MQVRRTLAAVGAGIFAYFVAVVLYAAAASISNLPQGGLWDPSFSGPLRFILTVVFIVALFVPAFRTEADNNTRVLAGTCASFLIVYSILKTVGLSAVADSPLTWVMAQLEPVGQFFASLSH